MKCVFSIFSCFLEKETEQRCVSDLQVISYILIVIRLISSSAQSHGWSPRVLGGHFSSQRTETLSIWRGSSGEKYILALMFQPHPLVLISPEDIFLQFG